MKLRFPAYATLPLLLSLAALAAAQTPTPSPMKMGLWQSDVTVQMTGMPNGVSVPPRTVTTQSCMTPDTWKDALRNMNHRPNSPVDCTQSNVQQDGHHYVYDGTCTTQQGMSMTIHVDMQFDSDESMHGATSATMTGPNVPPGMAMNSTVKSKFLGSDCGDVKPGSGKMVGGGGGAPPS
jgi:hypothetical protein